jgi:hypothetical protein
MSKPREILFAKHSQAEADLDRVAQALFPDHREQAGFLQGCWMELFWSCRAAWAGILAVWAVLLVLNVTTGTPPLQRSALQPLSREEIAWLQAQQLRFRTEFVTAPMRSEREKVFAPHPATRGTGSSALNSQSSNI